MASLTAVAALASSVAMGVLVARVVVSGRLGFGFLVWNLFLAWMPVAFAAAAAVVARAGGRRRWLVLPTVGLWLLFLPNAPYILTDVIHLLQRRGMHFWYDLGLVLSFALAGLLAGVASLRIVHQVVAARWGGLIAWSLVLASAMLSGLGIYLGRVLRWNSWDLLTHPHVLLPDLLRFATDPWGSRHALAFSAMFGTLFVLVYLATCSPAGRGRIRADRSPLAAGPAVS